MMTTEQRGRNLEDLSLLLGGLGFVAGGLVALLVLDPPSPLFGMGSVGEGAALTGGAVSGLAFLFVAMLIGSRRMAWQHRLSRFRRVVDLVGLTLVHAAISIWPPPQFLQCSPTLSGPWTWTGGPAAF